MHTMDSEWTDSRGKKQKSIYIKHPLNAYSLGISMGACCCIE